MLQDSHFIANSTPGYRTIKSVVLNHQFHQGRCSGDIGKPFPLPSSTPAHPLDPSG
jgi:hypothetical protein